MNKTAIKNYAIWARVQLIEAVKQRAYEYEITADGVNDGELEAIGGKPLSIEEINQRRRLVAQIDQKGYEQVMEEAAYTWFNRFIALRFMEVNGYLPSKIRVFTDENGAFKPEILSEAMTVELDGLNREVVFDLLDRQDNEALYKYLLITQCNALHEGLPYMFEKIANWTELLFPANLLRSDSVIARMVADIPEPDWTDQVQIIGWLYQYYNSELKDDTFALLKKNVKITKERIPSATQLFTPDWIVRYMVENSLGRLWCEGHGDFDKSQWKYYLDEAEQEPEVQAQLETIRAEYRGLNPQDIKLIDPCMGSGHILVYAFDVLMQLYAAAGWNERDAAQSILEHNLYGLDIDDRAAQLAYFAVMMKARQYDRRIFTRGIQPHVYAIVESNGLDSSDVDCFVNNDPKLQKDFATLCEQLRDAKEYGSILNILPVDFAALYARVDEVREERSMFQEPVLNSILPLIQVAEVMAQKYDVVVTNPPYMGSSGMSAKLSEFVKKNYPDSKSDLFAVFIEKCGQMAKKNGYQAMITQHAWMFLSSFEKLRTKLLAVDIVNMAHLGARAFEEIGGEVVQTTSFVIRKSHTPDCKGEYCRLIEPTTQQGKEDMFLAGENRYEADQSNFSKIPGSPVAYWVRDAVAHIFENEVSLRDRGEARQGLGTSDNNRFLRFWFEVMLTSIRFDCRCCSDTVLCGEKWFPYIKGGNFRRWYPSKEHVVNYSNDGAEIKASVMRKYPYLNNPDFVVKNTATYFHKGITWSDVSTGTFSARWVDDGYIYADAGPMYFAYHGEKVKLGYFNSSVFQLFCGLICQGLHYSTGQIPQIPYIDVKDENEYCAILDCVQKCISLSKFDWDSYETSWDFKRHPLV